MKGDSDKEKTETIMALRMKLDNQTIEIAEKSIHLVFFGWINSSLIQRRWIHWILDFRSWASQERVNWYYSSIKVNCFQLTLITATEQMYQQAMKEMAQKERDIQEMMTLADEAFQQKNGSTEKLWAAKIQKQQEEFRERDAAHQAEVAQRDETINKLRLELAQAQVANRRLSSHFSFPADADTTEEDAADMLFPCSPARPTFSSPTKLVFTSPARPAFSHSNPRASCTADHTTVTYTSFIYHFYRLCTWSTAGRHAV